MFSFDKTDNFIVFMSNCLTFTVCYQPKSSAAMMTKPMTKPEKMRIATRSMVFLSQSVRLFELSTNRVFDGNSRTAAGSVEC